MKYIKVKNIYLNPNQIVGIEKGKSSTGNTTYRIILPCDEDVSCLKDEIKELIDFL